MDSSKRSQLSQHLEWLLNGPVLKTLSGTRCRLAILDWPDLQMLCRYFGTDISGLEARLWTGRRKRKHTQAAQRSE